MTSLRARLLTALAAVVFAGGVLAEDATPPPLTLGQAIETVLKRYPTIDAAQAAVDASRARSTQASAALLPQVSGQGGYTYNSLRPYVAFTFPGIGTTALYESIQNSYNASVSVRQLLTDFGRTDALVKLARTGELTARDALDATRHQLGYETIQAFYGVLLLRQSVSVADEEIQSLEEARRIADRKFAAGSATKFDVLTTGVRQANARNRRTDIVNALEKQEALLRQLLGRGLGSPLPLEGDFDPSRETPDVSTAIAEGLKNRPEMKIAIDGETGAHLQLEAASREARPTIAAQAAAGVDDGNLPSMYDNRGYVVGGVTLSVPLFTGRRISGERQEARAGIRSAQARINELNGTIGTDVTDAISDWSAARARLTNADALVDQAAEALALARTRYGNGVITNFELLDAQSAARSAELTRLQARYDCVLASQAVSRAAGRAPQP